MRKCTVTFLHCVSCDAGLRPQLWPSFNLLDEGSASWCSTYLWKPPWFPSLWQLIRCVPATALQELLTCVMVLSVSMNGCALIQELVQRKCGGNYRCSLLEEIGQKFRVAGGPMDHWHAKQDLLQQFLSYGASCTEVLNLKWSIQSQLNGSAGVPPLLTISTARCMVNGLLLPEHRLVAVTDWYEGFLGLHPDHRTCVGQAFGSLLFMPGWTVHEWLL